MEGSPFGSGKAFLSEDGFPVLFLRLLHILVSEAHHTPTTGIEKTFGERYTCQNLYRRCISNILVEEKFLSKNMRSCVGMRRCVRLSSHTRRLFVSLSTAMICRCFSAQATHAVGHSGDLKRTTCRARTLSAPYLTDYA